MNLSNLIDATSMLADGDEISISASSQKYMTIEKTGRLIASSSESGAAKFQVESSGPQVFLRTNGKYVNKGSDGCLYASATSQSDALLVSLKVALNGAVVLASSGERHWALRTDKAIDTELGSVLGLAMEFGVHFTSRTIHDEMRRLQLVKATAVSECEIAEAILVWQVTGGFFLALGLGPYIATEEVQTGLLGLIRSNRAAWQAVQAVVAAIKNNPKNTATAVFGFLGVLYSQSLLWPVVRMVLTAAGWWVAFKVVAKILEVVLLPEAEAVELLASFVVWSAQTVLAGTDVAKKCN